tara:strand:- start:29 stop:430 length:402 start_codon:yes stop_codon:yes gene_type:complete
MRIDITTYAYIVTIIIVYFLGTALGLGQTFTTNETFKEHIAKDITVIEFWAEWNSANEFEELIKLKDCNTYRVDIMNYMDIQTKYSVTAIPTVIIFDNGVEKERFNPNIMFQLEADRKTIQNSVDTITLNKFQ